MSETAFNKHDWSVVRRHLVVGTVLALIFMVTLISLFWWYNRMYGISLGPKQPISISHRLHAGEKGISCFFCHSGAMNASRAGIPPLELCMLCHSRVIITYPEIAKLRDHYFENRKVEWIRVNSLPEFVYFNHSVHIHAAIDCGRCHGDIRAMDRIALAHKFEMGFCMECHRQTGASTDCFACHR